MSKRLPADLRRERTLKSAMRAFARKGFNGTTSRTLAKAAGVSEAMVFRQFGSKRGLYRAIIERKIQAGEERYLPREPAQRQDDEAVFTSVAQALLTDMEEDPTFMRLLLFSALEKTELSRMFVDRRVRKTMDFLAEYIARRMKKKAFVRADPHLVAIFFLGMLVQYVQAKQVLGLGRFRDFDRREVVDTVVKMTLGGLRHPAAAKKRR